MASKLRSGTDQITVTSFLDAFKTSQKASHGTAVLLVILGMSSFPARHEVYWKSTEKFVPSWERARTQHD